MAHHALEEPQPPPQPEPPPKPEPEPPKPEPGPGPPIHMAPFIVREQDEPKPEPPKPAPAPPKAEPKPVPPKPDPEIAERKERRPFTLRDESFGEGGLQDEFKNATWEQIRAAAYGDRE